METSYQGTLPIRPCGKLRALVCIPEDCFLEGDLNLGLRARNYDRTALLPLFPKVHRKPGLMFVDLCRGDILIQKDAVLLV